MHRRGSKYYTEENVTVAESVDVFCDQIDSRCAEVYDGEAVGSNGRFEAQLITDGGVSPRPKYCWKCLLCTRKFGCGGGRRQSTLSVLLDYFGGRMSIRIRWRECEASFDFVIPEKTLLK